jgi:acyl-coenzyme A thioesterase PaaI-like protein|tara:strand:- start:22151 stop:22618 length:468 start_codon:yes stop_codon:yes gene_type:complete
MKEISLRSIRWKLFLLGKFGIPMLGFARPKLLSIDADEVRMRIKLRRRTKNHLKSMYFGALAVGADTAAGLHAFYLSQTQGLNISLAFKAVDGQFLKRAETDVVFVCKQGKLVKDMMDESAKTGERINQELLVEAYNTYDEVVATFKMTLSLKVK